MTLKVVAQTPAFMVQELSDAPQPFLKNCQGWTINRQVDCTTGSPVFHLTDSLGLTTHTVTEYLIEDLDPEFVDVLTELKTAEEQQEQVCQYLQKRLNEATAYGVHIEHYKNQRILRFGGYGLKGGGDEKEEEKGLVPSKKRGLNLALYIIQNRGIAFLFSVVMVGCGLVLTRSKDNLAKLGSSIFLNAGYTSGKYTLLTKRYTGLEYLKQGISGTITGCVSGGVTWISENTMGVWSRVLGAGAGRVTSAITSKLAVNEQLPDTRTLAKEFCLGSFAEGVGVGSSEAAHHLMHNFSQSFNSDTASLAHHFLTKFVQGGVRSAGHQITINLLTKDKEGHRKPPLEEVLLPALLAGLVNGGMCFTEALTRFKEFQELRRKIKMEIRMFKTLSAVEDTAMEDKTPYPVIGKKNWELLFLFSKVDKLVDSISLNFENNKVLDDHQVRYIESMLMEAKLLVEQAKGSGVRGLDRFFSHKLKYFDSLHKIFWNFCQMKACSELSYMEGPGITPWDFIPTNGPLLDALQPYRTPYLKILGEFKGNPSIVQNNRRFAAGVKNVEDLHNTVVIEAFGIYQKTLGVKAACINSTTPNTGMTHLAASSSETNVEIMKEADTNSVHFVEFHEAICADLFSLFYKKEAQEQANIGLSPGDIKILIQEDCKFLKKLISNINKFLKIADETQQQRAFGSFNEYSSRLGEYLGHIKNAKQEMESFLKNARSSSSANSVSPEFFSKAQKKWDEYLLIAKEEWLNVEIPQIIEFDLGKTWHLSKPLQAYIAELRLALPKSPIELQELHQQLSCLDPKNPEDRYRLNIILSRILWSFKESIYARLMKNGHE